MSHSRQENSSGHRSQLIKGWLPSAQKCESPNFNLRPDNTDISLLVIHNISLPPEQFGDGYIQKFFCNQLDQSRHPYFREIAALEVSSHFLITRKGDLIQFVSTEQRAWHAGESCFQGRSNCNDYSVGIELEGADEIPYTSQQYETLHELIQILMQAYPNITPDCIVGHVDIAPERKTDPGPAFDWQRLRRKLSHKNKQAS